MKNIYLIMIILFLGGCATSYRVQVNGFAAEQPAVPAQAKIYVQAEPNVPNMLFSDQIKSKIQQLLVQYGYNPVNDPNTRYLMSYIFRSNDQIYYDTDTISAAGGYGYGRYDSNYYYQGLGWGPTFRTVWNYMMVLRIYDRVTNSQIWVGEAFTSRDLAEKREAVNYLLTALFRYFGVDTKKDLSITIKEAELSITTK